MVKPLFYGRLGNVLFQAASALAYSLEHGLEYTVPVTTKDPKWEPIYLQHLAKLSWNPDLPTVTIEEKDNFPHHQLEFKEEWREGNIILDGFWQTEKYFKHCRAEVEAAFNFPWTCIEGMVAVHVRRGDYLRLTRKHPRVTAFRILQVMDSHFTGHQFRFFSDDIPWCQQTFGQRGDCSFSEGDEVSDLIAMSHCEHQICSASTFSWWGAWLNRNPKKRIFMPEPWFVKGWKNIDTRDIVPLEWKRF